MSDFKTLAYPRHSLITYVIYSYYHLHRDNSAPFPPSCKQLPASDIVMNATVCIATALAEVPTDKSLQHFKGNSYEWDVDMRHTVEVSGMLS